MVFHINLAYFMVFHDILNFTDKSLPSISTIPSTPTRPTGLGVYKTVHFSAAILPPLL